MEKMRDRIEILGVPFSDLNMKETIDRIDSRIKSNDNKIYNIITGNPELVLKFKNDTELKKVINNADLITPDGVGIILASKWKGKPLYERVTGIDLLLETLRKGNDEKWSFYFLGAEEEVSKKAVENIMKTYPNVVVVGRHNGYYQVSEEENIAEEIGVAAPDILIVALGAPRAEKWIYRYQNRLNAKVAFGVGGSLDVISGKVQRAPKRWQKLKLEWLHRLITQPSRLKRQVVLPVFAFKSFIEAVKERTIKSSKR